MKTSAVSSLAISQALRYSTMRSQGDLVKALKELDTGKVADAGLALGARTAQTITFTRDLERLGGIVDSNGLVSSRLSSTQAALSQIAGAAQTFLTALTASASGDGVSAVTKDSADTVLGKLNSILNTSLNGEYLFAGINTDVKPMDGFAAGSPAKTAFDAAFITHFGFAQTAPAAANITSAQMDTFLTTAVEPQFLGAGWQANWSNATDQKIVSRIALNETTETSVSANSDGVRKLAMAAATISGLSSSNVSVAGKEAIIARAVELVGAALSDIAVLQAQTGIVEKRVTDASDRIKMQADLFERAILDMEGVDPYEAANRVEDLRSHLETSYALTARIQQLSLLRFMS